MENLETDRPLISEQNIEDQSLKSSVDMSEKHTSKFKYKNINKASNREIVYTESKNNSSKNCNSKGSNKYMHLKQVSSIDFTKPNKSNVSVFVNSNINNEINTINPNNSETSKNSNDHSNSNSNSKKNNKDSSKNKIESLFSSIDSNPIFLYSSHNNNNNKTKNQVIDKSNENLNSAETKYITSLISSSNDYHNTLALNNNVLEKENLLIDNDNNVIKTETHESLATFNLTGKEIEMNEISKINKNITIRESNDNKSRVDSITNNNIEINNNKKNSNSSNTKTNTFHQNKILPSALIMNKDRKNNNNDNSDNKEVLANRFMITENIHSSRSHKNIHDISRSNNNDSLSLPVSSSQNNSYSNNTSNRREFSLYNNINSNKNGLNKIDNSQNLNKNNITPSYDREKVLERWAKTRRILKGVIAFQKMSENIQLFGVSQEDFEDDNRYLKTLRSMRSRFYKDKNEDEQLDKKETSYLSENSSSSHKSNISFSCIKCLKQIKIPVFTDSHMFIFIWNIIIGMLMIYVVFVTPYTLAFVDDDSGTTIEIERVINYIFIADMFINFNLAYRENSVEVTKRTKIAYNYLTTWFFLDLVASFPFEYINIESSNSNLSKSNKIIRIARISKIYKLTKVFKVFKISRFIKRIKALNSIQDYLNINYGISRLITFVISSCVFSHIVGCLWHFIPLLYDEENNWVVVRGLRDETAIRKYFFSLYWSLTTIFTVGFGDITPVNLVEYIFTIIWVLFGVGFYSFTIGTLSTILVNMNTKKNLLSRNLTIINDFCKETKLSEEIAKEIKRVIIFKSNNNIFSWIEKQEIFNNLPANLKCNIAQSMKEGYLKNIYFFSKKEDGFISMIVPHLMSISFQPKEYIYKKGDNPTLTVGRIHFLTNTSIIYKTYVTGSYFGEYEIIKNSKYRKHTICADKNVETLTLLKLMYNKIIESEYPEVHHEMKTIAKLRKKRLKKDELLFEKGKQIIKSGNNTSKAINQNNEENVSSSSSNMLSQSRSNTYNNENNSFYNSNAKSLKSDKGSLFIEKMNCEKNDNEFGFNNIKKEYNKKKSLQSQVYFNDNKSNNNNNMDKNESVFSNSNEEYSNASKNSKTHTLTKLRPDDYNNYMDNNNNKSIEMKRNNTNNLQPNNRNISNNNKDINDNTKYNMPTRQKSSLQDLKRKSFNNQLSQNRYLNKEYFELMEKENRRKSSLSIAVINFGKNLISNKNNLNKQNSNLLDNNKDNSNKNSNNLYNLKKSFSKASEKRNTSDNNSSDYLTDSEEERLKSKVKQNQEMFNKLQSNKNSNEVSPEMQKLKGRDNVININKEVNVISQLNNQYENKEKRNSLLSEHSNNTSNAQMNLNKQYLNNISNKNLKNITKNIYVNQMNPYQEKIQKEIITLSEEQKMLMKDINSLLKRFKNNNTH